MRRRLFTILSALSLALALITVVLWLCPATAFPLRLFYRETATTWHQAVLRDDGLHLQRVLLLPRPIDYSPPSSSYSTWLEQNRIAFSGRWLGFVVAEVATGRGLAWARAHPHAWGITGTMHYLTVPYWFILLLTSLPGTLWLMAHAKRRRLERRRERGLCRACGYDLRASPERCPECGTPISQPRDSGTERD